MPGGIYIVQPNDDNQSLQDVIDVSGVLNKNNTIDASNNNLIIQDVALFGIVADTLGMQLDQLNVDTTSQINLTATTEANLIAGTDAAVYGTNDVDITAFSGTTNIDSKKGVKYSGGGVTAQILAGGTATISSINIIKNTSYIVIFDVTFTATPQTSGNNDAIRFDFITPLSNTPYVTSQSLGYATGSSAIQGFITRYDLTTVNNFTLVLNGNWSTLASSTRRYIALIYQ